MEQRPRQETKQQPVSSIKLHGQRKKRAATSILQKHRRAQGSLVSTAPLHPVRVVCISDTHNQRPDLPPGDVLIHAGDLTENGSFDEVQAGLDWLSAQTQYQHRILVAGNHDVLLDEAFLKKHPERRYGQKKTKAHLDWGTVTYLQDRHITLAFLAEDLHLARRCAHKDSHDHGDSEPQRRETTGARKLTIFGSPWTPQYGVSAFQYRPDRAEHWSTRFDALKKAGIHPDVLVTHGPPKHHCDQRDFHRAGCPYLAEEVAGMRPRLSVFGHIHAAYGREEVVLDRVQRDYEEVMTGWAGWGTVLCMAVVMCWGRFWRALGLGHKTTTTTTFVNASVVGGRDNRLQNPATVVDL